MKTNHAEVLVALTHFVKGAARFSFTSKGVRGAGEQPVDENRRRAQVLQELYRLYSVDLAGAEGVSVYRDTLPPDLWINDSLQARQERWRVQNVDGFRCEIFDVPA